MSDQGGKSSIVERLQDRTLRLLLLNLNGSGIKHSAAREVGTKLAKKKKKKKSGLLSSCGGEEDVPDGLVEYALEVSLRQRRALKILVGLDLLGTEQSLVVGHGIHALGPESVQSGGVFSEIELGAYEDDGDVGRMVVDLRVPL